MNESITTCPHCDSTQLNITQLSVHNIDSIHIVISCRSCSGLYTYVIEGTDENTINTEWFGVDQKLTPAQKRAKTMARRAIKPATK